MGMSPRCERRAEPFQSQAHHSISLDACLLAPGPFPDEDGGLGPDPGTHSNPRPKHGKQVDFLYHETGSVLDGAFRDGLVGLRGNRHVSFAPVENGMIGVQDARQA